MALMEPVAGSGAEWLAAVSGEFRRDGAGWKIARLPAPFGLWRMSISPDGDRRAEARLMACLSVEERARAARFRNDILARRYGIAHAALRIIGERCFGIPAASQCYEPNAHGKPLLRNLPEARCSLSYSGNSMLIAWSLDHEIGVDLERVRPIADAADLAELHCTASERQRLPKPGSTGYDQAFLALWVRKEACVKALGRGLDIPPSSFDCDVDPKAFVEIGGSFIESYIYDLKDDLLVSWARCIRMDRSDQGNRLAGASPVIAGVQAALRE